MEAEFLKHGLLTNVIEGICEAEHKSTTLNIIEGGGQFRNRVNNASAIVNSYTQLQGSE